MTNSSTGFSKQRVVVLGGSSGIGFAVAQLAAAEDAEVIIASSNPERVRKAVGDIGDKAKGYTLDLSDERAIEAFFQNVGGFDHLVYTAGDALQLGELGTMDLTKARQALQLRFWGALAAVKHAQPHIRQAGSIVLTTGIAGERPRKGWAVAASVCGAIVSLTRALAVELAPIRVNAVSPGLIRTPLWENRPEHQRNAIFEHAAKTLPVGRVGETQEVARTYLYLMQEGFSTGQTIVVDGGALLV